MRFIFNKKNKEASVYDCSNFDVELHRMRYSRRRK
jgi:hypothetical protein